VRITWITRSFLDYRIPVFAELDRVVDGGLSVLYYGEVVPERVTEKLRAVLGDRAVALAGEWRLTGKKRMGAGFANAGIRIPFQPGLIRSARRSEPDVVVSDGFFQWTYAALWLRATRGIPHVMCYERTSHTERNSQWYRVAYRKQAMRWIDAMCCNGRLCGEYAQSLGFPAERITYGHMVADVEGMKRAVVGVSDDHVAVLKARLNLQGLVFLYVGRLNDRKGIDKLLSAWKVISGQIPADAATLLLVGDGPQRGDLDRYTRDHGLANVRFAGAVDYDALGPYYRAADAFVIPTLEDNWSLVVPEAMACGLPILCSKYNGCWPEYVTDANGWIFDPLSLDETVDCLRRCCAAREKLAEMGNESRRIIGGHTAKEAASAVLQACRIACGAQNGLRGVRKSSNH